MSDPKANAAADRLIQLLDIALAAIKKGDGDTALMALEEGIKAHEPLKKKAEPEVKK